MTKFFDLFLLFAMSFSLKVKNCTCVTGNINFVETSANLSCSCGISKWNRFDSEFPIWYNSLIDRKGKSYRTNHVIIDSLENKIRKILKNIFFWHQNVTVNVFESWRKISNTMLSYMQSFTTIWNRILLSFKKAGKLLPFGSSHPIVTRGSRVSHAPPHHTVPAFLNLHGSIKQNGKIQNYFEI